MDQIVTLSDKDSTDDLQKYLSSLTDDKVMLSYFVIYPTCFRIEFIIKLDGV